MVKMRVLLDEVIAFLKARTELADCEIEAGQVNINDIHDMIVKLPTILIFVQPETSDPKNFDGYTPHATATVTIFTCCDGDTSQHAAIASTELAYLVEALIWTNEALRNYLDGLDISTKQANNSPHTIEYGDKVTYDDYYTDFASSFFSLRISIAK